MMVVRFEKKRFWAADRGLVRAARGAAAATMHNKLAHVAPAGQPTQTRCTKDVWPPWEWMARCGDAAGELTRWSEKPASKTIGGSRTKKNTCDPRRAACTRPAGAVERARPTLPRAEMLHRLILHGLRESAMFKPRRQAQPLLGLGRACVCARGADRSAQTLPTC
jgi:hypothetical protein